ncbi:FkbM family methyltransferase [Methylocella sp. CPCC 101449]|uniref:FkbM family methyltransferase n=1 Tax=Methylocella sp. CPCC 101449 TaxID=2987531 RepID=UPI00288CB02D|nr:FkbM family methyltransferase [Methylocella sp. CPCC 101449]MDT2019453.1 FkbM family methyltransferase [Methylocella sp. CPCC 101449]
MKTLIGEVVKFEYRSEEVCFFIQNKNDIIQKRHASGVFYEIEELSIIEKYFEGGVFLDVGTNVGNHAIFAAKYLHPDEIILIEPNQEAIDILDINLRLNELKSKIRTDLLGIGLSEKAGKSKVVSQTDNLGGARLVADEQGGIQLARGDDLLSGQRIDFIKLDVEGLEIAALNGLIMTIKRYAPKMFVEVDHRNRDLFLNFISELDYSVEETFKRYQYNENYMVVKNK